MFRILTLFCSYSSVRAWGGDGHALISTLATTIMSNETRRFLNNALEDDDLARASVWADSRDAEAKYPLSAAYHFSNTPYRQCGGFEFERDCGFGWSKGICIVTALTEAISRAADIDVSDSVRSDALKFILHLMADIHQPLHTGFRADSGGVRIVLREPPEASLHYIWDNWMIEEMRRQNNETAETILKNQLAKNDGRLAATLRAKTNITNILSSEGKIIAYISSLASETSTTATCNSGYRDANGKWISGAGGVIDGAYFVARQPVLVVQLLKAAIRLGILIDGIHETINRQKRSAKEKRRIELFSRIASSSASVLRESSNPFGQLYVEFDPDSQVATDITDIAVIRPPSSRRTTPSVSTRINETEEIETAIRESELEKLSYTFSGVDLSRVRLVNFRGHFLVTNETLTRLISDDSRRLFSRVVHTALSDGSIKRTRYLFDASFFPEEPSEELAFRALLKLAGVDPRINTTDYLETSRQPPPVPERDAEWMSIANKLGDRFMKSAVLHEINFMKKRISEMASKILYKDLTDNTVGVVHMDTLARGSTDRPPIITLAVMVYFAGAERPIFVFIDPMIIHGPIRARDRTFVLLALKKASNQYKSRNRISTIQNHVIWNEITEIAQQYQYQIRQMGTRKDSKLIQWVFDCEIEGEKDDDNYSLSFVNAVRRGFFNTTDELQSYINSTGL